MSKDIDKNVFDLAAFKKKKADAPPTVDQLSSLTDLEIQNFLKVCEYIRNMSAEGKPNTAAFWLTAETLKLETRHPIDGEDDEDDPIETDVGMVFTGTMPFLKGDDLTDQIEDFRLALASVAMYLR